MSCVPCWKLCSVLLTSVRSSRHRLRAAADASR
jgi:hypothetical protein